MFKEHVFKTFKIIHCFYDPETICSLFKLNESAGTKGRPFRLVTMQEDSAYYSVCMFYFNNRVINNWNNLPPSIVLAGTLNYIKNFLHKH